MTISRLIVMLISISLIITGLVFLVASSEARTGPRLIVGIVSLSAGIFLMIHVMKSAGKDQKTVLEQKIELSGDVELEDLKCNQCGASLSSENLNVRVGAVFILCPFCKSEYQLEEEPKW